MIDKESLEIKLKKLVDLCTKNEPTEKEITKYIREFYTVGLKEVNSEKKINAFSQVEKSLNDFENSASDPSKIF